MNIPDLEFIVVVQSHTEAGRNWLAKRMMPRNDMSTGVVIRAVDTASRLGDEAVADGLRISGLVDMYTFERAGSGVYSWQDEPHGRGGE